MWDKYRACSNLGIPYKVYAMPKEIGGYSELQNRYIHISPDKKDDDRVWAHEIAHTLCHFRNVKAAAGRDITLNALAEMEADTIAFVVCSVLGCADKKEYNKYMEVFISRLPLAMQTTKVIDEKLEYIKKQAVIILAAGGYYDERN